MDTPDETHCESAGDASLDDRNNLPELSRSATTLDTAAEPSSPVPVPVSSAVAGPALRSRKSLRIRPNQTLERQHAAPPSPLKDTHRSQPEQQSRPRLTKMSLFSLFSKPKVERQRGYAESGLEGPPRALSKSDAAAQPRPHLAARAHDGEARSRPTSSKSYSGRTSRMAPTKEPLPPLPNDRRTRSFEPPPLFQVWPQTTKHGTFEMTTVTPEMVLQKPKSRTVGTTLLVPGTDIQALQTAGNRGSVDSRVTVKSTLRHVANGSISGVNLPTKIFVLTTSGYLLQYAETGLSDRLPEKVLQLGRHSAAYASDLIPGKYHVLHIEQAVDQNGTTIANSTSFLSKIGLRSQVAKKMTSNFLIVMPGAREMEDWMTTIRQEIENHGGKRSRSDSSTNRPRTTEPPKVDLHRTPSLSHRYQIKRDTMIFNVSSLTDEVMKELPPPPPSAEDDNENGFKTTVVNEESTDDSRKEEVLSRRNGSDAASISSSTAASEDQQKLDTLRDSSRISHSTVATTAASSASRTNSITSTPPSEAKETCDAHPEANKGLYRNLSSYTLPKRRSAAPLMLPEQVLSAADNAVDSPILGRHPAHATAPPSPPKKNLSMARSVPNLKLIEEKNYTSALPMPPTAEVAERPESFVGDLPDPTTWAFKCPPASRASQQLDQSPSDAFGRTRPLRAGSQSFSLPLRVNPQEASLQRPVVKRASQSADSDARILSPVPAATTLVAKVDLPAHGAIDYHGFTDIPSPPPARPLPTPPMANPTATQDVKRGPSVRLSLFPTGATPPTATGLPIAKNLTRSPSATALGTLAAQQAQEYMTLKRPTSMQVRTNHAPFLASVRSPTSPGNENVRSTTTVPIRSLKPSRSVATMQTVHQRAVMKPEPFNFSTRRVNEEEADRATPLPVRSTSPPKDIYSISRPSSRTRGPRASASLPELDFGIPVVGLGPPAPPPQTPLPELPTHSRPASRTEGPMLRTGTPIGVAIGDIEEESRGVGLGIEVS